MNRIPRVVPSRTQGALILNWIAKILRIAGLETGAATKLSFCQTDTLKYEKLL